jgi:hypothetical protein
MWLQERPTHCVSSILHCVMWWLSRLETLHEHNGESEVCSQAITLAASISGMRFITSRVPGLYSLTQFFLLSNRFWPFALSWSHVSQTWKLSPPDYFGLFPSFFFFLLFSFLPSFLLPPPSFLFSPFSLSSIFGSTGIWTQKLRNLMI